MSHQGKSTTNTAPSDAFVRGKGGRGRGGGGGGRPQSLNKQQKRQNPSGGTGAQQQSTKSNRPPGASGPAGPAPTQNGGGQDGRKDGAASKTQSYVPKAVQPTPAASQQQPQQQPATSQQPLLSQQPQPSPAPSSAAADGAAPAHSPAATGNGAALQAPSPQNRPPAGIAAQGGQGPAPPFVGFTNGAGAASPPGGRGRGIPPRTQSAPPNLKEQKQSTIFIPARATPNPAAFPGAQYYPPPGPNAPFYPPPPGVQAPGVSPTHPYAPPGQGNVPPPRGALYQPPTHPRQQPSGPQPGGPAPQGMAPPHGQAVGPQIPPQTMGPPAAFVPPHRMPYVPPGRAPYIPRGPAGLQPMPPPHSMPMQIPQKRRSARIAIIDPKTGQEVTNSPPKESPLDAAAAEGTSPYQHSPPGSMRPPIHPYAPGTSPSRQPLLFKPPDTSDFGDQSGPVEQFAPNHPYAPGRSAAIPIEKPPSAAVTITKPPQPAAQTVTTPAPEPAASTESAPKEQAAATTEEPAVSPATPAPTEDKQPVEDKSSEETEKPVEASQKETAETAEKTDVSPSVPTETTPEAPKEDDKAGVPEETPKQEPLSAAEETKEADAVLPKDDEVKETKPAEAVTPEVADGEKAKQPEDKVEEPSKQAEPEKPAESAPKTDEKAAKVEEKEASGADNQADGEDDEDWEAKAEKEVLVLQKDISLRPSYAGSTGAFRSTLTPQTDASWSTAGGKRMYERDFLLKFQPYCRDRPQGLPPIEVILGNDDKKGSAGGRGGKGGRGGGPGDNWSRGQQPFAARGRAGPPGMPGVFAPVPGKFGVPPPGLAAPVARPGMRGPPGVPPPGAMRGRPLKKGIKGRETPPPGMFPLPEPTPALPDNPSVWKPSRRRGDDNQEIYGKVRNILNKLTGEHFNVLSQQMIELLKTKVTSVEILIEIINIIFAKALDEPGFCPMYAELCRVLEKNCPTFDNKEGKPQTFKRILLNRCQEAFEQKPQEEIADPVKKAEQEAKQKRRMIGNIIFIGELYKEHMLTDKIMHECVFRRLLGDIKNPVEGDLEALCKLMTTIGKVLDVPKAKGYMDAYFKRMKTLTQNPNIPSRIRFLILDVLDLRANKWISVVSDKPGKGAGRAAAPSKAAAAPPPAARGGGRPGAGGPQAQTPARPAADDWQTVGKRGKDTGREREPREERGLVQQSSGEVVLGPNSRMGATMGGAGAKGWRDTGKRPQDSRRDAGPSTRPGAAAPAPPKGNSFAALSDMSDRSPVAETRQARPAARDRSRSKEDREPSPPAEKVERSQPSPRASEEEEGEPVVGTLDSETEQAIKMLLEEFLDTQDEEEARQCVEDISADGFQPHLVKAVVVLATEKKEEIREMLLQLMTHLMKKSTIKPSQLAAGFRLVLQDLDDIKLDAPLAPKVVGQFLGSALLDNYLQPSFLESGLEPIRESGSAVSVLGGLLNFYIENTSIGETRDWAQESGIDVTSMFKSSNRNPVAIAQWLQNNGLDSVFPQVWAEGKIKEMLEKGDDVSAILKALEENVSRDTWQDEDFVQRVARLFVEFVGDRAKAAEQMTEEMTRLFDQYAPILRRVITDENQMVCLLTVQRYCSEQNFPDGLMESFFENLYNNDLVDADAFNAWAADTTDADGKARALAQLANWFNLLAEAQTEG